MDCIIVDDEAVARAIVAQLCATVPDLEVVREFSNAMEAMKFLHHHTVDLIFLDIHMPGFTGFDFVQLLKNPPKIVLISSDRNRAIEAYEYEVIVDYLVKPLNRERFAKSLLKVKNSLAQHSFRPAQKEGMAANNQDLYINIDRRLVKLKFEDILFIEAKGDYIAVKTQKEEYRVHSTLKKIKEKLPRDLFLQIHRSFIINVVKIVDIEDNSVLIEKHVIPISRSNRPELICRLNLL
jgi:DNA-binding LytR/AlgR family response regulator